MVTDEELSRFIDGELADDEMTAVRDAVASDAGLAARLERLRAADTYFAGAVDRINDRPSPDATAALLRNTTPARFMAARRSGAASVRTSWRVAASLAAAFAIGSAFGAALKPDGADEGAALAAGPVAARSRLADALGSLPSGASRRAGKSSVTPILSFRTASGAFCREFRWDGGASGAHAVACRTDGLWSVRVAVSEPAAVGYRPASSDATIDTFVGGAMAGEPLTTEEERAFLVQSRASPSP